MSNESLEELLFDMYLNYAKRALLGGGKGKFVMEQLRKDNPAAYNKIMEVARNEVSSALRPQR